MTSTIQYASPGNPPSGVTPYRSLVRYTAPASEPVTLAEAKVQCRVDTADDDAYITSLIVAARTYVEDILDISIMGQTWEARYDAFPLWEIILPRPPMANGTVTVTYRDEGGQTQSLSSATNAFQADVYATPGRIYPNYQDVWPAVRGDENSVVVRWSAGYAGNVPQTIKHMIMLLVAHWYETRQPVSQGSQMPIPNTFETLLAASGWGGYR